MASAIHQLIAQSGQGPDIVGSIGRGAQIGNMVKTMPAQARLLELQKDQVEQNLRKGESELAQIDQQAAAAKRQQGLKIAADAAGLIERAQSPEEKASIYQRVRRQAAMMGHDVDPWPDQYTPEVETMLQFARQQVYGGEIMKHDQALELEGVRQEGRQQMTPYQQRQLQLQEAQNARLAEQAAATQEMNRQNLDLRRELGEQGLALREQELSLKQGKAEQEVAKANTEKLATYNLYQTAMEGLKAGLEQTATGPIAGRIPAVTTGQQIAEGAVAALAPVLKQIFRVAGEGTFTDKDQELLLNMVPTRKDTKEAAQAKLENIDRIIQAKLGIGAEAPARGGTPLPQPNPQLPEGVQFLGFE